MHPSPQQGQTCPGDQMDGWPERSLLQSLRSLLWTFTSETSLPWSVSITDLPLRFWHFLWPWSNMVNNFLLHPSLSVTSKMKQGVPTFLMDTSFFDPLRLSPKVTESQPDSIKILEGKYCFFPSWPCCKYIYKEVTNTVLLLNVLYFQE